MGPLEKGDKISIIATAGTVDQSRFERGLYLFEHWGLIPQISSHVLDRHGYFAGTDEDRKSSLQAALDDPEIKAVFCARGGYGTTRIIDGIDFSTLQSNPKWVIGFSDITALHLKLSKLGLPSIHGPMPIQFGSDKHRESVELLRNFLFNTNYSYHLDLAPGSFQPGKTNSILTGGNLALLCDSLGTSSELDTNGKILFLEEIGEPIYRVDRMLWQFKRAGKLDNITGLLVGQFTDLQDSDPSFGLSLKEMIEAVVPTGIPVVYDFPAGHEAPNYPLVINGSHELHVEAGRLKLSYNN